MRSKLALVFLLAALTAPANFVLADDPPDSEQNPVTAYTETVDVSLVSGARVRHTTDVGGGVWQVKLVSSGPGVGSRLAIEPGGDSWVTWWNPVSNRVYCAVRHAATGTWSAETLVSREGEDGRNPEILHGGSTTWIAWEVRSAASTSIAIASITDDPQPIPVHTTLSVTGFLGDVDVRIHAEAGHVWVTWVDSLTLVAWSEFDAETGIWGQPTFESYLGTTAAVARGNVRSIVLGP